MALTPAHADLPCSVFSLVYISEVFIFFPRMGGDTGRKCDLGFVVGQAEGARP